ncbi:MAG TPA: hypothetical protein VHF89_12605, partial [Solirubrobacteraceae bacterium]|nr:hypothetical protein [Solirubrobacteraceae bacterium]
PKIDVPRTGSVRGSCGDDATVHVGPHLVSLRARGGVPDLDRGHPLRATGCREVTLPAQEETVLGGAGALRVDHLRLASGAGGGPPGTPLSAASPGHVVDPGDPGRGTHDDIRLDVRAPAWLVVGEAYSQGWRATCDGRDLGEPVPLQGFANAWAVEPGCTEVDVAFAPNRLLPIAYVLSLLACVVLLALALRRPREPALAPLRGPLDDDPAPRRFTPRQALLGGLLAGALLGFAFAIRAGVVIAPAVALILWRGIPARQLALAGGGLLLVVVPVLYLAVPGRDPGGYNSALAVQRIAAHWVGVAAVVLIGLALWRTLRTARSTG